MRDIDLLDLVMAFVFAAIGGLLLAVAVDIGYHHFIDHHEQEIVCDG